MPDSSFLLLFRVAMLFLLLTALSLLLSSCATLLNSAEERIVIFTETPTRVVWGQDTFTSAQNRIRLQVPRSLQPLEVKLLHNYRVNTFYIPSVSSFAYWSNVYTNYGIGMLVDQNNPKRYAYPAAVFIDPADSTGRYRLYSNVHQQGEWLIKLGLPYFNTFYLQPDHEPAQPSAGFWGIATAVGYYTRRDRFLELGISAQTDFFLPVLAAVDISGEYEFASSWYLYLAHHHRFGRFVAGYGLSYSRNTWEFRYSRFGDPGPPTREPVSRSAGALGLYLPLYFYTGNHFYINLSYRPSFRRFSALRPWAYEHLTGLGIGWEISLR